MPKDFRGPELEVPYNFLDTLSVRPPVMFALPLVSSSCSGCGIDMVRFGVIYIML